MNARQQAIMNGLNTSQHKIDTAGQYSITTRSTVNSGSGIVVTAVQSGSKSVTYTTPTTSAQAIEIDLTGQFNCATGDIITVTVSSSATADQPPSLVKTTINLRQGV
jgi:hypothetical protein